MAGPITLTGGLSKVTSQRVGEWAVTRRWSGRKSSRKVMEVTVAAVLVFHI